MKVSELLTEAKRVASDKGYYTPGYREETKTIQGTVKDWMARLNATPDDIKKAMAAAQDLPSYKALTDVVGATTKPGEAKNGTFSFYHPSDKANRYMIYANGQLRMASPDSWDGKTMKPTRLTSPKPHLKAGDVVGSLTRIYDGAFKELAKKAKTAKEKYEKSPHWRANQK